MITSYLMANAVAVPISGWLYREVLKQGQVLAYIDVFFVLAIGVALVTPLLLFMRDVDLSAPPP